MLMEELFDYYGTWANMSRKLELGSTTYLDWKRKGYIPWKTQCVLEKQTNSLFKADLDHCKAKG